MIDTNRRRAEFEADPRLTREQKNACKRLLDVIGDINELEVINSGPLALASPNSSTSAAERTLALSTGQVA